MDALEVEMSLAAGEQALQALLTCARESARQLAAHDAEQGLFTRLLPIGLAAMQRSLAQRGTGDVGPAIRRADGVLLPREHKRRGRDSCSRFGTFAVVRTCDRLPGEPGICPLDAQVHLPERCDSYVLPAWMTLFAVEPPFQDSAGLFAPLLDLEVAESVWLEVAKAAPQDDEAFSAPRPLGPEDTAGECLVVSCDGTGGPMITAEAAKRTAQLGTGETRPKTKEALVGGSDPVAPKPRSPEALAARLVDPDAARVRRPRADTRDEAPRAQQVRRVASLAQTKPQVMACIRADAERRDPQHRTPVVVRLDGALGLWRLATPLFTPWTRVTVVLDILPVVGDRWSAANAWCGAGSKVGKRGVQQKLTEIRRGRVGSVIGGLRHILTKPRRRQSVREALAKAITFFRNHRRGLPYDASPAAGLPVGTGGVESACGAVVKSRMEGEGQRWSLGGAEAMLTWRSLKKSHDHNLRDYWRFRAGQERVRLYASKPTDRPMVRLKCVA